MTTTYADPTRCPDCRAMLPHDPQVCRVCSLPLTGETARALFTTFQEADRLLAVLRSQRRPAPATVAPQVTSGSLLDGATPYPAPGGARRPQPHAPRVSGASVPRILLSLGALCLLVAAVAFLAVAWAWLGVGGRTVVLVALTGTALGLGAALHRRGLRMAAESLSVVGLGLLTLDVIGVRHAGWLGEVGDGGLTLLIGAVVGTGALLMLAATSTRPLTAPGAIAPVAALVAGVGSVWDVESAPRMIVTCAVLLALGRVGSTIRLRAMVVVSLLAAGVGLLYVLGVGFDAVTEDAQTAAHVWGDAAAWPLVVATALVAAAAPAVGLRRTSSSVGYGVAWLLGSYVAAAAALDNGETQAVASVLLLAAVWTVALAVVPATRRTAVVIPAIGTLVVPVYAVLALLASSTAAVLDVGGPFTKPFGVHVAHVYVAPAAWLLTPSVVVVSLAACAVASWTTSPGRRTWIPVAGSSAVAGGALTLPLYDVPLALVVGVVLAAALAAIVSAERLSDAAAHPARLGALVLITVAVLVSLPSDRITAIVLAVACAVAGYLMTRTDATGAAASACYPVAFAGVVWAGGNVVGIDGQLRAIPVLVVLGGLAIWRPQVELEVLSAFSGAVVSAAAIALAQDLEVSLAVHLTVAGVLVTASSLIHPSRRVLAWPGGLLLAAATWVRLLDLGVHVPEAYTLPSALVLVAVGAWRLRQDHRSATLTYLLPGLTLATVPSLLAMLDDPFSLRALLLGLACLALTVSGVAMRWGAPLVVGSTVGALLVLRELAPYAAQVPTWLTIGAAGALLLAVGITWESRMHDLRRASHYVAALR